ncbi:hypothetical protein [Alcaligenes sp. WGS1538]|uniref:hypothetical protein n=1 Tax=Alcaligenes sp. WGS1538 TaxID=3366811 RepID=UPI00372D4EB4
MTTTIFVNLNGNTVRIDPRRGSTSHLRLTVASRQAYREDPDVRIVRSQVDELAKQSRKSSAMIDSELGLIRPPQRSPYDGAGGWTPGSSRIPRTAWLGVTLFLIVFIGIFANLGAAAGF